MNAVTKLGTDMYHAALSQPAKSGQHWPLGDAMAEEKALT